MMKTYPLMNIGNFLKRVFEETYRVLVPDYMYYVAIGKKTLYTTSHSYIIEGYVKYWIFNGVKLYGIRELAQTRLLLGDLLKPIIPTTLKGIHEYILIFRKHLQD